MQTEHYPSKEQMLMRFAVDEHRERMNDTYGWLYDARQSLCIIDFTLFLSFGRGAGHTTFILENAKSDDVIIVGNANIRDTFIHDDRLEVAHNHIFEARRLDRTKGIRLNPPVVWIDGLFAYYHLIDSANQPDYVNLIARLQPSQIVVLGS